MVLTALTLLGLLHGLVLLPVLLSILGPPPEVTTLTLCSQPRDGTGRARTNPLSGQQTRFNSQVPSPLSGTCSRKGQTPLSQTPCPSALLPSLGPT